MNAQPAHSVTLDAVVAAAKALVPVAEQGLLENFTKAFFARQPEEDLALRPAAAWAAIAAEYGIALDVSLEARHAPLATPGRLEQVLDNLIANALDASPNGSTVTIGTVDGESGVELHVIDEGSGMTDADRARAFDRFWSRREQGGSGLGLAIVHRLVTNDGGTVALRNLPAGGLDVVISLPAGSRIAVPVPTIVGAGRVAG